MTLPAPLLLVGAAGHCHALLAVIQRQGLYRAVGLIDSQQPIGSTIHGLPVLGREVDAPALCRDQQIRHLFVAVGHNTHRQHLSERLLASLPGIVFPALVDPSAVIAADARIGAGVAVMALAHIGAGSVLADGALINTAASLDHDSQLDSFASLAPGVVTGGGVQVGARSALCLGARVVHRIFIGADTVVGAGALVMHDLPAAVVAYGAPARVIRSRDAQEPYL